MPGRLSFRWLLLLLTTRSLFPQTPEPSFAFASTQPSLLPPSRFYGTSVVLPETNAIVSLHLNRRGPTNNVATVQLLLRNETAIAGEHFQLLQDNLAFLPGETNKSISLRLMDDTNFFGQRSFTIHLYPPHSTDTNRSALRVFIADDELGFLQPQLAFDSRPGYPNKLFLPLTTPPGRYAAERSPNLTTWTPYGEWTATELMDYVFDTPDDFPRQFYRVRRLPEE